MYRTAIVLTVALRMAVSLCADAAVPNLIDYQGALTDAAGNPVSGQRDIRFAFYDAQEGGTLLWQEAQAVGVQDGVYSTALGSVTAFPDDLWDNAQLWLGVKVGDDAELAPRARIVAVPYARKAHRAEFADSVPGGQPPVGAVAVSAVGSDPALLAAGYVTAGRIVWESVGCWRSTSTVGAPGGRENHTAVWTGDRMIVWGGRGDGVPWGTGGLYDPTTDVWTPTATDNAPSPRENHTAVWTGTRMIVWGGGGVLDTGGVYDPITDTWTPTSTTNAPEGRNGHAAVWTGKEMLVWGGAGAPGRLNTGGAYDPATDTWTPTSTTNAPSGRTGHTAVWTGEKMIVWGGDWLDTGGLYDPQTDSWAPTATVNAPTGRKGHVAFWTGTEMLVWGAVNQSITGGGYDPALDTWRATSTDGVPFPEFGYIAAWTGTEMVVYGWTVVETRAGGVYNPTQDKWRPVSAATAPVFFDDNCTAVWAGDCMVSWGSPFFEAGCSPGWVYYPSKDVGVHYLYLKQ